MSVLVLVLVFGVLAGFAIYMDRDLARIARKQQARRRMEQAKRDDAHRANVSTRWM
jgi:hypothetical protein